MTVGLSKHPLTFAAAVSGSLGADLVSDSIDIGDAQVVTTAIQLAWTGTPTGTAYVEESVDGVNWSQLATVALAGSASSAILDVASVAISLRVRYSRASSTGALTGVYFARVGGSLAGAAGGGTASHVVVDSGTLSLPAGASTAAKQPALGTAGAAAADVLSVQGIAGGTAIPVSNASLPLPTGAATAAKQPALGTAGSAATDVITVQGIASGTAQPVSAAALPLPAGAATSAKQAALGTAGSASADVLSVQGVASMTALKVDGSGVTQPVSTALPTALIDQAAGSVGTSAQALGSSQALVFGCYVTNTHASQILYLGSASVSTTRFMLRLLPGQTSPLIPVGNFTAVNVVGSGAATTYSFGGE